MKKNSKIFVAGHRGMVGSAILRKLTQEGYQDFVLAGSKDLDLRNQLEVTEFFRKEKPTHVFLAAAKVGGIFANNTFRAEFLYDNLMIEANVIHAAYLNGVEKLKTNYCIVNDKHLLIKCRDNYEDLCQKTLYMTKSVTSLFPDISGLFKIDDDIIPNLTHLINFQLSGFCYF